ncbi:MAG: ABC transporter permease [Chloroflexi bacterium]|nr:ABC transporter permease [Chloroflexota bacterium]
MSKYIAQRLLLAVPTVLGLTMLVFFVLRVLVPVDAVDLQFAAAGMKDPEQEAALRESLGITGPLPLQYLSWLGRLMTGDFGVSFYTGRTVVDELALRIPTSLEVGMGALMITIVIAIPIGVYSAVRQDSGLDYLARGGAILFYAIPGFWLATLILVFGSLWLNWAPPTEYHHIWEDPIANLKQVALPMFLLGLSPIGTLIRLVRTQVLEVIRQDYVRTARAKGLAPSTVYTRHVLRNSLLPIVTVVGLQVPNLIAGTVIFEQVFVLPGVGRYLLDAVLRLDLFVLMATNLFFGSLIILSNLVVDVSYGFIDPRVRYQ